MRNGGNGENTLGEFRVRLTNRGASFNVCADIVGALERIVGFPELLGNVMTNVYRKIEKMPDSIQQVLREGFAGGSPREKFFSSMIPPHMPITSAQKRREAPRTLKRRSARRSRTISEQTPAPATAG